MSRHHILPITILALALFAACGTTTTPVDCGVGQAASYAGKSYCVYNKAITEEGFLCPAALPHRHELGAFLVCAADTTLPANFNPATLVDVVAAPDQTVSPPDTTNTDQVGDATTADTPQTDAPGADIVTAQCTTDNDCPLSQPVCHNKSCVYCVPNSVFCDNTIGLRTCSADGMDFVETDQCFQDLPGKDGVCDSATSSCKPACTTGSNGGCGQNNTGTYTCDANGTYQFIPCPAGNVCVSNGRCVPRRYTILTAYDAANVDKVGVARVATPQGDSLYVRWDTSKGLSDAPNVMAINARIWSLNDDTLGAITQVNHGTASRRGGDVDSLPNAQGNTILDTSWFSSATNPLYGVRGQWFDQTGALSGAELVIADDAINPDVLLLSASQQVIVYQQIAKVVKVSLTTNGQTNLLPLGVADTIPTTVPRVGRLGDGFLVAFEAVVPGSGPTDIWARCYDKDGVAIGNEPLVLGAGVGQQHWQARIAGTPGKHSVVVWRGNHPTVTGLVGQLVDTNCAKVGDPLAFEQASGTLDASMWSDGTFVVVYSRTSGTTQPGIYYEIRANDGTLLSGPTQVAERRASVRDLRVLAWGDKQFALVWSDQYGVYGLTALRP